MEESLDLADGPLEEGLRIGMLNVHSLTKKMDFVKSLIHKHMFDIFVVVETWFHKGMSEEEKAAFAIEGYHPVQLDRKYRKKTDDEKKKAVDAGGAAALWDDSDTEDNNDANKTSGGGIMIYVKDDSPKITIDERKSGEDKNTNVQYQIVRIIGAVEVDLIAVYNPNKDSAEKAYRKLKSLCAGESNGRNVMWIGDFNVDAKGYTYKDSNLYETMTFQLRKFHEIRQLIHNFTHIGKHSATAIDHIYTNIKEDAIRESGVIRSALSDHDLIYCTVSAKVQPKKCDKKLIEIHENFDYSTILLVATAELHRIQNLYASPGESKDMVEAITDARRNPKDFDLIKFIRVATAELGQIHTSYSSPNEPTDIMSEALSELHQTQIDVLRATKLDDRGEIWNKHTATKEKYSKAMDEASKKNISYVKEFKSVSTVLSLYYAPYPESEMSPEKDAVTSLPDVKHHMAVQLARWAILVGKIKDVEQFVSDWVEREDIGIFIKHVYNMTFENTAGEYSPEFPFERLMYSTMDSIWASKLKDSFDLKLSSRKTTMNNLVEGLKAYTQSKEVIVAVFWKFSSVNIKILADCIECNKSPKNLAVKHHLLKRLRNVDLASSRLFAAALEKIVKGSEVPSSHVYCCDNEVAIIAEEGHLQTLFNFEAWKNLALDKVDKKALIFPKSEIENLPNLTGYLRSHEIDYESKSVNFLGIHLDQVILPGSKDDPGVRIAIECIRNGQIENNTMLETLASLQLISEHIKEISHPFIDVLKQCFPELSRQIEKTALYHRHECRIKGCSERFLEEKDKRTHESEKHAVCPTPGCPKAYEEQSQDSTLHILECYHGILKCSLCDEVFF